MKRSCGVLLALSSLPGPYGIGTMGKGAYRFAEKLARAGQSLWQVLPLSPAGMGNSPYQSVSAFAGSPDLIDFELLYEDGLLTRDELASCAEAFKSCSPEAADYEAQKRLRPALLLPAYEKAKDIFSSQMKDFAYENAFWIHDYALFMALSERFGTTQLSSWPEDIRLRDGAALIKAAAENRDRIGYYIFEQFIFCRQWARLKAYANSLGISIIGDMPFYVSGDSADRWANSGIFDREGRVAGCPPDYFSPEGQLWGNPVYDWDAMHADGYGWWMRRIGFQLDKFDILRIDHFRGFEAYYSIPAGAQSAAAGRWNEGPGDSFIDALRARFDMSRFIAEDLGTLTDSFFSFMSRCGLPGLKVLQFAFEPDADSIYLPHHHTENSVVYTGTHDNDTVLGWYMGADRKNLAFAREYLGPLNRNNVCAAFIRCAYMSCARMCVIPAQDLLGLGNEARMNTPSTVSSKNWAWRMKEDAFDESLCSRLARLARTYGR